MAEVSFNTPPEATPEVPNRQAESVARESTAHVPAVQSAPRNRAVALRPEIAAKFAGQFEGDFDQDDFGSVYVTISQGNSPLVNKFGPRKFIVGGLDGHDLGTQIDVIFTKVEKYFIEDLPEDAPDGVLPKRFDSLAEAERAGYSLRAERGDKKIVKAGRFHLFIVLPADHPAAESADFIVNGSAYISAIANWKKGAYRAVIRVLTNDTTRWLRGRLTNGVYTVTIADASWQKKSWLEPRIKAAGKTSDAVREEINAGLPLEQEIAAESAE